MLKTIMKENNGLKMKTIMKSSLFQNLPDTGSQDRLTTVHA